MKQIGKVRITEELLLNLLRLENVNILAILQDEKDIFNRTFTFLFSGEGLPKVPEDGEAPFVTIETKGKLLKGTFVL